MFSYNHQEAREFLEEIIKQQLSIETYGWLKEKLKPGFSVMSFNTTFVSIPRKTGKGIADISAKHQQELDRIRPGLIITGWTLDKLVRVWALMHVDPSDKNQYIDSIENLFHAAEVKELVALYSALPLLAYPQLWAGRCAEGIRNNIGDVLEAVMCNNPYPSENLSEPAWNQLVLKAFFTEKPIEQIQGLDKRANEKLARTLSDYAHERWAAHRSVNPLIWRCVGPFLDEILIRDIQKLFQSGNETEKEAAALACADSSYPAAKTLIPADMTLAIQSGLLNWTKIAEKSKDYVLQP